MEAGLGTQLEAAMPPDDGYYYVRAVVLERFVARPEMFRWLAGLPGGEPAIGFRLLSRRTWGSTQRAGRIDEHVLGVSFGSAEAQRRWVEDGCPDMRPPHDYDRVAPVGADGWAVAELATTASERGPDANNPEALYERFASRGAADAPSILRRVQAHLASPQPMAIRKMLVDMLAVVPGVDITHEGADLAGRPGILVLAESGNELHDLVLQPRLLTPLGWATRSTSSSHNDECLKILRAAAYVERGVTRGANEEPPSGSESG